MNLNETFLLTLFCLVMGPMFGVIAHDAVKTGRISGGRRMLSRSDPGFFGAVAGWVVLSVLMTMFGIAGALSLAFGPKSDSTHRRTHISGLTPTPQRATPSPAVGRGE